LSLRAEAVRVGFVTTNGEEPEHPKKPEPDRDDDDEGFETGPAIQSDDPPSDEGFKTSVHIRAELSRIKEASKRSKTPPPEQE
jgi:hypothetical protein